MRSEERDRDEERETETRRKRVERVRVEKRKRMRGREREMSRILSHLLMQAQKLSFCEFLQKGQWYLTQCDRH